MDKCEKYFEHQLKELSKLKAQKTNREGTLHAIIKGSLVNFFCSIGLDHVETEVSIEGVGIVDVMAYSDDVRVVVECGHTTPKKILALEQVCDVVIHIPYCYTPQFIEFDFEKIQRKIISHGVAKQLRKEGHTVVVGKRYCLEGCEGCDGSKLNRLIEELR